MEESLTGFRKQLGLSKKIELARQLGISHRSSTGASGVERRDILLRQSWVIVSESHEGLLQEREPEEELTRKPKVEQGDGGAKEGA